MPIQAGCARTNSLTAMFASVERPRPHDTSAGSVANWHRRHDTGAGAAITVNENDQRGPKDSRSPFIAAMKDSTSSSLL